MSDSDICYWPDGSVVSGTINGTPCTDAHASEHGETTSSFGTCCPFGALCLPNGLCQNPAVLDPDISNPITGEFGRYSCTDSTFASCPQVCTDSVDTNLGQAEAVLQCDTNVWCCDRDGSGTPSCCEGGLIDNNPLFFALDNGQPSSTAFVPTASVGDTPTGTFGSSGFLPTGVSTRTTPASYSSFGSSRTSTASAGAAGSSDNPSSTDDNSSSSSSFPTGAVVGGVVGGVVALALIALAFWWLRRRRSQKSTKTTGTADEKSFDDPSGVKEMDGSTQPSSSPHTGTATPFAPMSSNIEANELSSDSQRNELDAINQRYINTAELQGGHQPGMTTTTPYNTGAQAQAQELPGQSQHPQNPYHNIPAELSATKIQSPNLAPAPLHVPKPAVTPPARKPIPSSSSATATATNDSIPTTSPDVQRPAAAANIQGPWTDHTQYESH